jgi:hypothetical protein
MNKVIATKEIYLRIIDFAYTGEYSLSYIFNKMKYLSHSIRSFRCMNQHEFTFHLHMRELYMHYSRNEMA